MVARAVAQGLVRRDCDQRPEPLVVDRLVTLSVGDLKDVREVDVRGEVPGVVQDGEAGEPGAGAGVVELGEGDVLGDGEEFPHAEGDAAYLCVGESQGAGEEFMLVLVQETLAAGLGDEAGDLVGGEGGTRKHSNCLSLVATPKGRRKECAVVCQCRVPFG